MKHYYIGIDLGGTNIKAGFFGDDLSLLCRESFQTEAFLGPDHVLDRLLQIIHQLLQQVHLDIGRVRGIGIGLPGSMDMKKGISLHSPNLPHWNQVPVAPFLHNKLKVPIFIDNDARVNLYGEWHQGAGIGKSNLVLLTLGTGIGSGILMNGHVLYGATARAGEIGHMSVFPKGRPCSCGGRGCLETYASARGLVYTFQQKVKHSKNIGIQDSNWPAPDFADDKATPQITPEIISKAFDAGDERAISTYAETGEILGYGLTNIVNLFNPERIIIGGGLAASGERLLHHARKIVTSYALRDSKEACEIVTGRLGNDAGIFGAAIYAKTIQTAKRSLHG